MNLRVRANDELVLDAGETETVSASELVIHPPRVTLFQQVLAYLRAKPVRRAATKGAREDREGVATAAVVLRWGTYFAVLADRDRPVWAEVKATGTSRISDSEMARINIEASAALAEWIDLARTDRDHYAQLVERAAEWLPMPKARVTPDGTAFAMLAMPELGEKLIAATDPARLTRVRADGARSGTRIFANALINFAWRNGPVEDVHAGEFRGYPLDRRRVTTKEEAGLLGTAIDRLAVGMDICHQLRRERPSRPWSEQVLPYALAELLSITPSGWTLTEATRAVRLRQG